MSKLVVGIRLYRHIPPPSHAGATARDIAQALGLSVRTVQRHLVVLARAGLARCEQWEGYGPRGSLPARWWRA